ncbi:MAG: right-handed parallel beta-helix repeat-containing protein, partial [Promethearchaeota archaeon]
MKKKNYIIVSIIVFSFFNLVNFFYINNNLSKIESNTDINYNNMDNLETSGYWDFISIHIDDNNGKGNGSWAWASAQPWCKGSGTFKYPYIIENLTIDAKGISSGIIIENSKVYFIIENCTVINSGSGIQDAGIKLINCSNGIIQNNNLSNNGNILGGHGILLNGTLASCKNNTISNNKIYDNGWAGIYLETDCNNNIIYNNSVGNNIGDPIPPFPPLP